MAKLRKMLCKLDDPSIMALMDLIQTQSKKTLAQWSINYAQDHFLGIYEKAFPGNTELREAIVAVRDFLAGRRPIKEVKPFLKNANEIARNCGEAPAAQAAARAVATACAVIQTPTNALGYTFYGVAAVVYDREGLDKTPEFYDAQAAEEFKNILASLRAAAVPDEADPVKIQWNC